MSQLITCPQCQRSYPLGTLQCPVDGASLAASMHVASGLKVGEYVLEQKLGEGGMGEVWGARHPQIGKQVAIKLLSEKMVSNRQAITRFMQEARAVNEIQHKNIVDIFAFGELPGGRPYFVMEFLKGQSLGDYLFERGPLPLSEILAIFEQVCAALQASHDKGIIHRDLKPDNLFLIFEGATRSRGASLLVKILDFGIAKLDAPPEGSLTKSGATMGTPAYMSPEQCEGAKTAEQASDIYSLGIILFELLTGRTPFRESDDGVGLIISKHMFMPAPPPSSKVSGRTITEEVDAVVLRALAKKPKERFASCADLFDALLHAAALGANEASETSGAKPLYQDKKQDTALLEQMVVDGISKKVATTAPIDEAPLHAEDYYSSSQEGSSAEPRSKRFGGLLMVLIAFGFGAIVTVLFVTLQSPQSTADTDTVIEVVNALQGSTENIESIEKGAVDTQPAPSTSLTIVTSQPTKASSNPADKTVKSNLPEETVSSSKKTAPIRNTKKNKISSKKLIIPP